MTDDNKLLISRVNDLIASVKKGRKYAFTSFLNELQLSAVVSLVKACKVNYSVYGGYDSADRCIVGFGSDDEPLSYNFPISTVTFDLRGIDSITHRDVLGALMSLGIKRECLGDIIFLNGRCYFFCDAKISEYICMNLLAVSSVHIDVEITYDEIVFERAYEEQNCIVASMRLDCVISELTNKSRTQASEYIESGMVFINGIQCLKKDRTVLLNDIISIRRVGKFFVKSDDGLTKKNRIKLKILKYI